MKKSIQERRSAAKITIKRHPARARQVAPRFRTGGVVSMLIIDEDDDGPVDIIDAVRRGSQELHM